MEAQPDDFKKPRVDEAADATILDVLNADCWRHILDNVPVNDVVRSECVSRAWQQLVLNYLAGVKNYRIEYRLHSRLFSKLTKKYQSADNNNYCSLNLRGDVIMFEEMIQKMGPFIVRMVANIVVEGSLEAIALHCTNLEALTVTDSYLTKIITSETLEELIVYKCHKVTGRFLENLQYLKLKSLTLKGCIYLLFKNIQSADYLTKLTQLELTDLPSLENVHLLLDKMPDLEHLSLMDYNDDSKSLCNELPAAIGRLSRLKELHLWGNGNVTDEWLSAVACGCPELRTLNVGFCSKVTGRAVVALCRARPTLVELVVAGLDVTDSDLQACALYCKHLHLLDAIKCELLTKSLPKRLAKPCAPPLLLRLRSYPKQIGDKAHYEGLTVRWNRYKTRYENPFFDRDSDDYDEDSNEDSDKYYESDSDLI